MHTLAELAAALEALRAGRSYTELAKAVRPARLAPSTLSDLLSGETRPSAETLELFLTACGVPEEARGSWRSARKRALTVAPALAGVVRVEQADPRLLGVHAAIEAPSATGELPVYVLRDTDTDPRGVRALVGRAAERGGLVVLVGSSSVGKTRCAYEAIRALVPQWWLLHPADADHVRQAAADPPSRLVVWLDELQRYLGGPAGLRAATVRALLQAGAAVVATVWPERHAVYTTPPCSGGEDPYVAERELLDLAGIVHLDAALSPAERKRARAASRADPRIALALESADYGLTQVIAAAPQLIDRWRGADPYQSAVLNAAVDATRLGVQSPLSAGLLRAASPGYCDARQRAAAPANWFEGALAYATETLHGAAAALAPVAAPGTMGRPSGYLVADYLQQHAGAQRRTTKVPGATWRALCEHLTDPADQASTGRAAQDRLLYCYAEPLYRHAADAGDESAATSLVGLLVEQGRAEEAIAVLRTRADTGDDIAALRLSGLLVEQGRAEEAIAVLRTRADIGDPYAAYHLVNRLVEHGRAEELRARADTGDTYAAQRLVNLLLDQEQVEEAVAVLRPHARAGGEDAGDDYATYAALQLVGLLAELELVEELCARADTGDTYAAGRLASLLAEQGRAEELRVRADTGDARAARWLARLLTEQGRVEEAIAALRPHADTGDTSLAVELADLLAEQGRMEGAAAVLRARADAGDIPAARRLAELLAGQGRMEEAIAALRPHADTSDTADTGYISIAVELADLLVKQERVEEAITVLRPRADTGDIPPAQRLADLLLEQGRVEEAITVLRPRVDAYAACWLVDLLVKRGRAEEAIAALRPHADTGDLPAAQWLSGLLVEQGQTEELRARADAGDTYAAHRLASLLIKRGRAEEAITVLRPHADAGGEGATHAAHRLVDLLAEQGQVEELRTRADTGDTHAARQLSGLLAKQGRTEELRARADTGDTHAAGCLADLLAEQGRVEELRARVDSGDTGAAFRLVDLLAEQGQVEELRTRAATGNPYAAHRLVGLLARQGPAEQAKQLRRFGVPAEED
ncbi:helix-turn-helix domain-containing protein [Streptosporangium sp. NPDC002607]